MKTPRPDIHQQSDPQAESPTVSFAHLNSLFLVEGPDDLTGPAYGFPAPQEEELYETGILSRIFLKC